MKADIPSRCDDLGIELSISAMCISLPHIIGDIKAAIDDGISSVHVDIIEPRWGPPAMSLRNVGDLKRAIQIPIDVHLMVADSSQYLDQALQNGADRVMIPHHHIAEIYGPDRDICPSNVVPVFESSEAAVAKTWKSDVSLVMSVQPGDAGRPFENDSIDTVRGIRASHPQGKVFSDGSVSPDTGRSLYCAGSRGFVVGSSLMPARRYDRDSIMRFCRKLEKESTNDQE